jgi:hypothetical protein
VDWSSVKEVGAILATYLQGRLGAGKLQYAEGPTEVPQGWEVLSAWLSPYRHLPRFRNAICSPSHAELGVLKPNTLLNRGHRNALALEPFSHVGF